MKVIKFKAISRKTGKEIDAVKFQMTEEEYKSLDDRYLGLCLACGSERYHCEPDARRYECEDCGENRVYGHMELLMMGRIEFVDEEGGGE